MNTSKQPTLQESMKMLGEMTLLDRFLFSETMSDPEAYTAVLQIITRVCLIRRYLGREHVISMN